MILWSALLKEQRAQREREEHLVAAERRDRLGKGHKNDLGKTRRRFSPSGGRSGSMFEGAEGEAGEGQPAAPLSSPGGGAPVTEQALADAAKVQEARNTLFCPSQEKFHTVVLQGVRNISDTP